MDNRERARLLMAHLRATRRAHGLCARCGMCQAPPGRNCDDCNDVRRVKRDGGYVLDARESTRVA